ncbi:hypothetical protein HZB60_05505 [candidate division KSB1 bacterium]|nr:hypothetical protein [candidate division KSB1 bacterium]
MSVRELVGNPDLAIPADRAWQHIHHAVQAKLRRKHKSFRSELPLRAEFALSNEIIAVSGRLDGLRRARTGAILYEIKPVPSSPRAWLGSPALEPARRQLRFYADLALAGGELSAAPYRLVLLLVGPDGNQVEEDVPYAPDAAYLRRRLFALFDHPLQRRRSQLIPRELFVRDACADRPLQLRAWSELCSADSSTLLLALPPGSGKTRIALRFALEHASTTGLPIHWITSKSRGREEVLRELARLSELGLTARTVWKTSLERRCPDCPQPQQCERRLLTEQILFFGDLDLAAEPAFRAPESADHWARDHNLCPHALSSGLEPLADLIVADLNYRLIDSTIASRAAINVIDEAQNVAQRARDLWSIHVPDADLRATLRSLTPGSRSHFLALLDPMSEADASTSSLWSDLHSLLREQSRRDRSPVFRFAQAVSLWQRDFVIARGAESGAGFWIGIPRNLSESIHSRMLDGDGITLALTGSLPAAEPSRKSLLPGFERFHIIEPAPGYSPPVHVIPLLEFTYPLTLYDHEQAVSSLQAIVAVTGPSILVFGQNAESNQLLCSRLRGLGATSLLDADLGQDWQLAVDCQPDFVLTVPGSNLAESISPPESLFRAAVVLSAGHRPPSAVDRFESHLRNTGLNDYDSPPAAVASRWRVEAASRIVQAMGRLNRRPESCKPVFLLNRAFAEPDWLQLWPRHWSALPSGIARWDSLPDCLANVRASHAAN